MIKLIKPGKDQFICKTFEQNIKVCFYGILGP